MTNKWQQFLGHISTDKGDKMNLFQEAKKVLDKDGKVNALGPYGKSKLTGKEVSQYFKKNPVKDKEVKKAVEVALDLGGAHSVASKEIAKFYGNAMLKNPDVKKALLYANESIEERMRNEDTLPDIEDSKRLEVFIESSKMTSSQKKEFDKLYKKMDGGKEHQAIKRKIGNPIKADDAFHSLVMKKVMGEQTELTEMPAMPSVQSGDIDLDSTDHTIDAGVINYVTAINNQLKTGQFAKMHKERGTEFKAKKAKRFWRIEQWEMGRAGSIHAFIEVETGDIYKPAGWKAAAKGARGNVTDNRYIKFVAGYPSAYHGGHLYK